MCLLNQSKPEDLSRRVVPLWKNPMVELCGRTKNMVRGD